MNIRTCSKIISVSNCNGLLKSYEFSLIQFIEKSQNSFYIVLFHSFSNQFLIQLLSYKLVFMSSIWKLNLFLTSDTWINVCSKVTLVKRSCQMFPLRLNLLKIVMRQTATAYQDRVNFHSLRILTLLKRWNAQRLKFSLSILARDETIYVRFKHLSILSQGF